MNSEYYDFHIFRLMLDVLTNLEIIDFSKGITMLEAYHMSQERKYQ